MPSQTDGRRLALVVATSKYNDPTLQQLRAPGQDATALAKVLRDPGIGGFEVRTHADARVGDLQRSIVEFCTTADPGDLLLLYLSCHGLLDDRGRLYYATINTERSLLAATAISAQWLNEQLDDSRAKRQVLILDCCHSGAFAKGTKGASDLALESRFAGGRGKIVLTASRATEYSFEDSHPTGAGVQSVFTRAIVEGLTSGDADRDHDGLVSVTDLYHHVYDTVRDKEPRQSPELWTYGAEGSLILAVSPRGAITTEPASGSPRALVPEPVGGLPPSPWTSILRGDIAARGAIHLAALSPDCSKLAVWRGTSGEVFDVERRSRIFEVDRAPGARFWWKPKWLHITTEPPLLYVRINDAQFAWNLESLAVLAKLPERTIKCTSADGKYLFTTELAYTLKIMEYGVEAQRGRDRITIWDGRSMAPVRSFDLRALVLAASLARVAIADECRVQVFDIEDGHVLTDIAIRDARALALSADGSVVAVGVSEVGGRVIYTYNTETSELISSTPENYEQGMELNRDGSLLAIGYDKWLAVKDVKSGEDLTVRTFGESILCFRFRDDRSILVVIGGGAGAKIVQVQDPSLDSHSGEGQL